MKSLLLNLCFVLLTLSHYSFADEAQDLASALPRTPGGHPDFNGMWIKHSGGNSFNPYVKEFKDQKPPLTPEYQKVWDERMAARARGEPMADPTAACLPGGIVRLMNLVLPSEIVQTDKMIYWAMEWNNDYIRIYLDGRDLPGDLYPTYNGFSRGHWEGDTLVVNTVALRGDTHVESSGIPHTDKMTLNFRMRYIDLNTVENIVTVTDPIAFTEPWSAKRLYKRPPDDYRMLEYICLENNRNPIGADGKTKAILLGNDE
jgi:hypothetical protein